ncbi:type II secretion system minor pseudopilin GspK [Azoarcus sp. L1K30]|uniref:type II secretion system minor pseudopilin GspK n=1 Tax=Azoarcus sp. L1K30 TaxID=2820277 RepID=UPI001B81362A|nr:type II secretion system minor pseudopilin GspK [Azoarcus sp. L1K30]MBR0565819.1 type II secretion system minor pseudopilin GspK [Azoarcus sp. L1K30]
MTVRSPALSPCAERARQRGAAVVLALLTVTLAAVLAASVLADVGYAIEAVSGRRDQAQSQRLARAAVDWARQVLAQDGRESNVDHGQENWTVRIPATPLGDDAQDGTVAGEIVELSGRFNINELAPEGVANVAAGERLQRLLTRIGEPPETARALTQTLTRWIAAGPAADGDPAPHAPLVAVDEVAAVVGIDPSLWHRLQPFITAVPTPSPINVNTAPAEVLSALVPGLDLNAARVLVAERDHAWFRDLADFGARLPAGASPPSGQLASVSSHHFLVTIHASYGVAVSRLEALLERRRIWPEILWYRIP